MSTLETYEVRFPHGLLAPEVERVRLHALVALDRRSEALHRLDALELEGQDRGGELATLRGELRAREGRCSEAVQDFSRALPNAPDRIGERALFGRSACLASLGDRYGARRDLEQYLKRFPSGRHAGAVRHALAK
jgi:Flp pilus assembly protein TadD